MKKEEILSDIIKSFNSLWQIKHHGATMEVITPMSTINNSFVSVFISKNNGHYIVSDGGWMASEAYGTIVYDLNDKDFGINNKLFEAYLEQYKIKQTASPRILYYKAIEDIVLVPNIVYDVANFISIAVSSSFISVEDRVEKEAKKRFSTDATSFIKNAVQKGGVKFGVSVDPSNKELTNIKFSAVVLSKGRMIPISYVTGSKDAYFKNSLSVAYTQFQALEGYGVTSLISKNVSIIDDTSYGYAKFKNTAYLRILGKNSELIEWTNRSQLAQILHI